MWYIYERGQLTEWLLLRFMLSQWESQKITTIHYSSVGHANVSFVDYAATYDWLSPHVLRKKKRSVLVMPNTLHAHILVYGYRRLHSCHLVSRSQAQQGYKNYSTVYTCLSYTCGGGCGGETNNASDVVTFLPADSRFHCTFSLASLIF